MKTQWQDVDLVTIKYIPAEMIFRKFKSVILTLLLTEILIVTIYKHYGNSSISTPSDHKEDIINVFLGRVSKIVQKKIWNYLYVKRPEIPSSLGVFLEVFGHFFNEINR